MIVAAATVPGAPLLLPGVTGGPVREVAKAREAMAAAVTALLDQGAEEIVVVGGAPATRPFPPDAPGPEQRVAPGWRRPHHDRRSAPDGRRGGAGASPEVPGGPEKRVAPGSPGRRWPRLDHRPAPNGRRGDEVLPEGAYSEVSGPGGESVPGSAGSGGETARGWRWRIFFRCRSPSGGPCWEGARCRGPCGGWVVTSRVTVALSSALS
ncbi:hypothetical protein ACFSTC_41265 [Nonomuraea ferruginea]